MHADVEGRRDPDDWLTQEEFDALTDEELRRADRRAAGVRRRPGVQE